MDISELFKSKTFRRSIFALVFGVAAGSLTVQEFHPYGSKPVSNMFTSAVGGYLNANFPNARHDNPNGLITNMQLRYQAQVICGNKPDIKRYSTDFCNVLDFDTIFDGTSFVEGNRYFQHFRDYLEREDLLSSRLKEFDI